MSQLKWDKRSARNKLQVRVKAHPCSEKTNRFSLLEIMAISRLHLLEHTPISDLWGQHAIHPTMFYRWQKQVFESGAAAFESRRRRAGDNKDRRITLLQQKLQRKTKSSPSSLEEHINPKEVGEDRNGVWVPQSIRTSLQAKT